MKSISLWILPSLFLLLYYLLIFSSRPCFNLLSLRWDVCTQILQSCYVLLLELYMNCRWLLNILVSDIYLEVFSYSFFTFIDSLMSVNNSNNEKVHEDSELYRSGPVIKHDLILKVYRTFSVVMGRFKLHDKFFKYVCVSFIYAVSVGTAKLLIVLTDHAVAASKLAVIANFIICEFYGGIVSLFAQCKCQFKYLQICIIYWQVLGSSK